MWAHRHNYEDTPDAIKRMMYSLVPRAFEAQARAPSTSLLSNMSYVLANAPSWSGFERGRLFFNKGGGVFEEFGAAAGVALREPGRAVGAADLDLDGAVDLIVRNAQGRSLVVLKNELGGSSILVRLRGVWSNRFGIGAAVTVDRQTQEMRCGGGYLMGNAPELHFGVPSESAPIRVRWPSGRLTVISQVPSRSIVTIGEDDRVQIEPTHPSEQTACSQARMLRQGDAAPGWTRPLVVVWGPGEHGRCKARLAALGAAFIEDGIQGLVHPTQPTYPVVYVVGKSGKIIWKWAGPPDMNQLRRVLDSE